MSKILENIKIIDYKKQKWPDINLKRPKYRRHRPKITESYPNMCNSVQKSPNLLKNAKKLIYNVQNMEEIVQKQVPKSSNLSRKCLENNFLKIKLIRRLYKFPSQEHKKSIFSYYLRSLLQDD